MIRAAIALVRVHKGSTVFAKAVAYNSGLRGRMAVVVRSTADFDTEVWRLATPLREE